MPFTWNISPPNDVTIGTNIADDWLAAMDAHLTANPPLYWERASYSSSSPRYLMMRPRGSGVGRIIYFGQQGSTPNAAATRATPALSTLYIGFSPSSTSDTPDASYLSGAPLSASDYMAGLHAWAMQGSISDARLNYIESSDIFAWLVSRPASGFGMALAGYPLEGLDGTLYPCNWGTGGTLATSQWPTSNSPGGSVLDPSASTNSMGLNNPGFQARIGGANRILYRLFVTGVAASVATVLNDSSVSRSWFLPITMIGNTSGQPYGVVGKLRQIAIGPNSYRETSWLDASTGTLRAYGHSHSFSGSVPTALWFLNNVEV